MEGDRSLRAVMRHPLENKRAIALALLWIAAGLLLSISLASFVLWQRDLHEIRTIVQGKIDASKTPNQIVLDARNFLRDEVGYGTPDSYFMLPVFRFMKPTALQVIHSGGDCAFRARAFIVVLAQFGIEARKLALYNRDGVPVHAVAEVYVDGGPYYVDLLYNFAHVDSAGRPLTLAELSNDEVLRASVARAVSEGNERAARYPLSEYTFGDVRSINWDKSAVTKAAYAALSTVVGEERARWLPRPYLTEEPALMVIVISAGAASCLLVLIWGLHRARPRAAA